MSERVKLSTEEAITMLPKRDTIHTFRNPGPGMLVGADWTRDEIIESVELYGAELSGEKATQMGHGMLIRDDHGYVFIETKGQNET